MKLLSTIGGSVDFIPPIATLAILQVPGVEALNLSTGLVLLLLGAWLLVSLVEKGMKLWALTRSGPKIKTLEGEICSPDGALQTLARQHDDYLADDLSEIHKVTGKSELAWTNHTPVILLQRSLDAQVDMMGAIERLTAVIENQQGGA